MSTDTQGPLQILVAGKLYAPEEIAGPAAVVLEGTKIRALWRETDAAVARERAAAFWSDRVAEVVDLGLWSLAPGYVDLHLHGFHGHDVTTDAQAEVEAMARELPRTGVTAFLPTLATVGKAQTAVQVRRVADAAEQQGSPLAAEILGLRLEGPFISLTKRGAQYKPGIRPPDPVEMEELATLGRGWIRVVDYAPEEDPDTHFLTTLTQLGIVPSLGHTIASYEQAIRAIDGGARHATHLFNAMPPLDHRAPGVAGAFLTDPRTTVEIIADGVHLHPALTKLVTSIRSIHDVALVTDAISPTGLPEGEYTFVERKVYVQAGEARLADGTLAGSVLTLDRAVRNMVAFTGLGWSQAIQMATYVPARIAGIERRKGSIVPNADADLIALDKDGFVQRTWVRGQLA